MAQRTQVIVTDDIDGSAADFTIRFGFDGTQFEIDLNSQHADEFQKAISPFVDAARKVGGGRRASRGAHVVGPSTSEVRQWAKEQGIEVKDRGRVPDEVVARFKAAQ